MDKICKNCKYFNPKSYFSKSYFLGGLCEKAASRAGEPEDKTTRACAMDYDGYVAELHVAPDFGCNMFEPASKCRFCGSPSHRDETDQQDYCEKCGEFGEKVVAPWDIEHHLYLPFKKVSQKQIREEFKKIEKDLYNKLSLQVCFEGFEIKKEPNQFKKAIGRYRIYLKIKED